VLTANWLIGLTSLIVLVLLAVRTPKEEAMLIERFGDQYRDYTSRPVKYISPMRAVATERDVN
jgi:protein-S-isoprenylcysteine O-methyltransferase Ste14